MSANDPTLAPSDPPAQATTPEMAQEWCCLCGVELERLAGNPSLWPIHFPHPEEPGVTRAHCTGCVTTRMADLDRLRAEAEALRAERDVYLTGRDSLAQSLASAESSLAELRTASQTLCDEIVKEFGVSTELDPIDHAVIAVRALMTPRDSTP